ncbi:hypothetical protein GCM10009078_45880 [Cupriavidus gilardii]
MAAAAQQRWADNREEKSDVARGKARDIRADRSAAGIGADCRMVTRRKNARGALPGGAA